MYHLFLYYLFLTTSKIPVVSAVGHEIDWALSDYAADCRAPTPSAAAEIVVPQKIDILNNLQYLSNELHQEMTRRIDKMKSMVKQFNPDNMELKFQDKQYNTTNSQNQNNTYP